MKLLSFILLFITSIAHGQSSVTLRITQRVYQVAKAADSITYFGDSFTKGPPSDGGSTYPTQVNVANSIPFHNYSLGGTSVCTNTYAPVPGNSNLIDTFHTELNKGYHGQMVSFCYGTNDQAIVNGQWKATYEAIIDSFIVHGWPRDRLLIIAAPCTTGNAPLTAPARAIEYQIYLDLQILFLDEFQVFLATGNNDALFDGTAHPLLAGQVIWKNSLIPFITQRRY